LRRNGYGGTAKRILEVVRLCIFQYLHYVQSLLWVGLQPDTPVTVGNLAWYVVVIVVVVVIVAVAMAGVVVVVVVVEEERRLKVMRAPCRLSAVVWAGPLVLPSQSSSFSLSLSLSLSLFPSPARSQRRASSSMLVWAELDLH